MLPSARIAAANLMRGSLLGAHAKDPVVRYPKKRTRRVRPRGTS
jgi:hypothetical protein